MTYSQYIINFIKLIMLTRNNSSNIFCIDLTLLSLILLMLIYSLFINWSACGQNIYLMQQKVIQIILGLLILILFARIPPKIYEIYTPYIYYISIILLILVYLSGHVIKGAQRWLNLGIIQCQPSEIVKLSVLFMVTRYLNTAQYPPSIKNVIISLLFIGVPTILILLQPDLGTAILTASSGVFVLFFSGIQWKLMILIFLIMLLCVPIFWHFFMYEYQKSRILVLWNPESDPLGSGYHIIQSKIAIGSGGFTGKGWLHGTQSQLEFLPERHTDFIFSVIGEELGFAGISILLILYLSIICRGFIIANSVRHMFGKLIIGGFMLMLFTCIFINIGMVSGILPVVGVPLPLISYGGSSLLVFMAGFGSIMSIRHHRKMISKYL